MNGALKGGNWQTEQKAERNGHGCQGISDGMVDMPAEMSLCASARGAFPNAAYGCIIKNGSATAMVIDCWTLAVPKTTRSYLVPGLPLHGAPGARV